MPEMPIQNYLPSHWEMEIQYLFSKTCELYYHPVFYNTEANNQKVFAPPNSIVHAYMSSNEQGRCTHTWTQNIK